MNKSLIHKDYKRTTKPSWSSWAIAQSLLQQANIEAILQDMDEVDDVQVVHICAWYSNLSVFILLASRKFNKVLI
jgi:hypothetical protein